MLSLTAAGRRALRSPLASSLHRTVTPSIRLAAASAPQQQVRFRGNPPKKPRPYPVANQRQPKSTTLPDAEKPSGLDSEYNRYNNRHRKLTQEQQAAREAEQARQAAAAATEAPSTETSVPESETFFGEENVAQKTKAGKIPALEDLEADVTSKKPLPDLRYGIPSSFGEEAGQGGRGDGGRGDGELPRSAYESSIDKRRNRMANYFALTFVAIGAAGLVYLGRNWETEEEEKRFHDTPSGWNPVNMYYRAKARVQDSLGYYTEPAFPKLLPDMTDQPMPPYTLVISLEDMLVHSEWTREHGWRTAKRPGVDFFLLYLSQYYELCLFTSAPNGTADPIYRKLDPYHLIPWPLFRESTRYEKGEYVKDLSYLNRPLEKTILVDTKPGHAKAQPENAIILKPWDGDPNDRELLNLIPFLEYVAAMGIPDIRAALKSFEGTHIPTEFAKREELMRAAALKELGAQKKRSGSGGSIAGWVKGLVKQGSAPPGQDQPQSLAEAAAQGKTIFDVMREDGMKRYRMMEKEIRENGAKWLQEEADMMKRLEEEQMKTMKSNPFSVLGFGPKLDPNELMAQIQKEKEAAALKAKFEESAEKVAKAEDSAKVAKS